MAHFYIPCRTMNGKAVMNMYAISVYFVDISLHPESSDCHLSTSSHGMVYFTARPRPRPSFPSKYYHHQGIALHITDVTRRRGWEHEPRSRSSFFPSIPSVLADLVLVLMLVLVLVRLCSVTVSQTPAWMGWDGTISTIQP